MLLDAVNICNDVQILNILSVVKTIIKIVTLVVPIILIIFIVLDVIKTLSSSDVDTKKMGKSIITRIIAAIVIFLIPFIIEFAVSNVSDEAYYLKCYDSADKNEIASIARNNYTNSYNACVTAINTYSSTKTTDNYNDAFLKCEQAKKDARLIVDKGERISKKNEATVMADNLEKIKDTK